MAEKVTVPGIVKMKREGKKITCLTAYDYSLARILDDAGVDVILVRGLCRQCCSRATQYFSRDDG